jgi:hypothetical protein
LENVTDNCVSVLLALVEFIRSRLDHVGLRMNSTFGYQYAPRRVIIGAGQK